MWSLEYVSANTIPEDEVYTMMHQCTKCLYNTKSWFFINNHIERHLCREPSNLFDCMKSDLEHFVCRDCNFGTFLTTTFRNHIMSHKQNVQHIKTGRQTLRKRTFNPTNEIYVFENYQSKSFIKGTFNKSKRKPKINNVKWFHCDECSFKSRWNSHLKEHFINQHRPADIKWYHCDECSYKTKWKFALERHFAINHEPTTSWLYCDKCSYKGKVKDNLAKHIMRHHSSSEEIKWFECYHCPYKSKYKYDLKGHMINHRPSNDVTWFHCDKCSYKTKWRSSLREHIIRHHTSAEESKWFSCEHCSYKSKYKRELQNHMTCKHAPKDATWFYCDKCSYKSTVKRYVRKHFVHRHA